MQEAADSLIRGLSPYYEAADLTIPGKVVQAIQAIEKHIDKATDAHTRANAYQASLMLLGGAIGEACHDKKAAD